MPARQVELWRQTTPEITGYAAALAPFVLIKSVEGEDIAVCVREYAYPGINVELLRAIERQTNWVQPGALHTCANFKGDTVASSVPLFALLEHPVARIKAVWRYCLCNEHFKAIDARRFAGMWHCTFPEFMRWLMYQDPLMCDPLVRPQWIMLPANTQLFTTLQQLLFTLKDQMSLFPDLVPVDDFKINAVAFEILQLFYAEDFQLWAKTFKVDSPVV